VRELAWILANPLALFLRLSDWTVRNGELEKSITKALPADPTEASLFRHVPGGRYCYEWQFDQYGRQIETGTEEIRTFRTSAFEFLGNF
jgi:hypothetical protein